MFGMTGLIALAHLASRSASVSVRPRAAAARRAEPGHLKAVLRRTSRQLRLNIWIFSPCHVVQMAIFVVVPGALGALRPYASRVDEALEE